MSSILSTTNHNRDAAGLTYVYPVMSRRAGGLSIGINFNTNNACNWRCLYCQVPDLKLGSAPVLDLQLLERELRAFLADVLEGDFFERVGVAENNRVIKDIAISGNGEPTSLKDFAAAVASIGQIATEFGVFKQSKFVLITNGSLMHHARVQDGLKVLHSYGGEVWFKFDSATDGGRKTLNNAEQSAQKSLENLQICSEICATKLQICLISMPDPVFMQHEQRVLLGMLKAIRECIQIRELLIYTIARPSLQPEANLISKCPEHVMNEFANIARGLGYQVSVSA
jgi:wyosine [tRNA(Phe)-imidazoG37] synthetase (radical SAM superfamily)